jgi:4-hydroxybenzoate decarboxylase subunit C
MKNIRSFVEALKAKNDLCVVDALVDPVLEIPEIHRRVIENNGKALLFTNVKGSQFPVATNLFGNVNRIELAFGKKPEVFVKQLVDLAHNALPPKPKELWKRRSFFFDALKVGLKHRVNAPVFQNKVELLPKSGLSLLPALHQWPEDGGRFVTLPLVYTEHPETKKHNLGMYRIHIYDEKTTGMHWQIHKGGGNHYHVAEQKNESLPVTLMIGGPPALILSAIAPLPEDIPELLLCSLLLGEKLKLSKLPNLPHAIVSECEFAIVGQVSPHKRRLEGPFGDHYGYYSLAHDYPVFDVTEMYHRDDAIYPATVVGKPRQEDFFIGDYLQNLLSPLFPLVMPGVKKLKTYGETGFHALASCVVKDRYPREAMASALRVLGEGQLSLQKFLMVTDSENVNLDNFPELLEHFLARTNWFSDYFVLSHVSQDTLDYSGPKVNKGSKAIWLALGPAVRSLQKSIPTNLPPEIKKAICYVPGCLVISGVSYETNPNFVQQISSLSCFKEFQLVVVVDNAEFACSSAQNFLWNWFTRFEPAADTYAHQLENIRFHVSLHPPIFFDSRMKPWYPGVVEASAETVNLVSGRWKEYFGN